MTKQGLALTCGLRCYGDGRDSISSPVELWRRAIRRGHAVGASERRNGPRRLLDIDDDDDDDDVKWLTSS